MAPSIALNGPFIPQGLDLAAPSPLGGANLLQIVNPMRLAFALLACPLAAAAADPVATLTLLEGQAAMVRGVTRYALAEGVGLQPGDIVEVGDKGLAQVEFAERAALALGPGTRMLALSIAQGKPAGGDFYALRGALKLSGVKRGAHFRIATPLFALQPAEGTAVLVVGGGEGSVFVESGDARLTAAPASLRLKGGDFFTRKAGQKGAVAPRPSPAFIGELPRLFLDPLPSRMARYKERQVQPRQLEVVSYAEVEAWLKAPPEVRRPLAQRFAPRASDPAFRSALISNLRFHPEWDPILYPEKLSPKEPKGDAASAARGDPVSPKPAGNQ